MNTKKGHDFELDLVKDITTNTPDAIRAHPLGYSGNHKGAQADVLVTTNSGNHVIEVKNSSSDTFTVSSNEIDQLEQCVNANTVAWIGLKYSRRQLCMIYAADFMCYHGDQEIRNLIVEFTPDCFNPRIGRTGTFITDCPGTDDWSSKQSGMDAWRVVSQSIGLDRDVWDSKQNETTDTNDNNE